MGYVIGGVIGIIIALVLIGYGIKGGTIIVSNQEGQSAPVSGQPNWLMIILGIIIGISSIAGLIKGASH
ncbi:MAG: hypothetical protein ACM3YM_11800 [Sphingomonadales bacterium]